MLGSDGFSNVHTFAHFCNNPLVPEERNFGDELLTATLQTQSAE